MWQKLFVPSSPCSTSPPLRVSVSIPQSRDRCVECVSMQEELSSRMSDLTWQFTSTAFELKTSPGGSLTLLMFLEKWVDSLKLKRVILVFSKARLWQDVMHFYHLLLESLLTAGTPSFLLAAHSRACAQIRLAQHPLLSKVDAVTSSVAQTNDPPWNLAQCL